MQFITLLFTAILAAAAPIEPPTEVGALAPRQTASTGSSSGGLLGVGLIGGSSAGAASGNSSSSSSSECSMSTLPLLAKTCLSPRTVMRVKTDVTQTSSNAHLPPRAPQTATQAQARVVRALEM